MKENYKIFLVKESTKLPPLEYNLSSSGNGVVGP